MPQEKKSDLKIEDIGKKLISHIRQYILHGTTQLAQKEGRVSISSPEWKNNAGVLFKVRENESPAAIDIDADALTWIVLEYSEIIKKFNVGACAEYALLGFAYMIKHAPEIKAEIYNIANGDHAFLVLNRQEGSDPHNPLTWGDDAYICDPWANKLYPAKDYQQSLKGCARGGFWKKYVTIIAFDEKKHFLTPHKQFHPTDHILKTINHPNYHAHIKENYKNKLERIIRTLIILHEDFTKIGRELFEKKGDSDANNVINKKNIDINKLLTKLILLSDEKEAVRENDYFKLKDLLKGNLLNALSSIQKILTFTKEEKISLSALPKEKTFMSFFSQKNAILVQIDSIFKKMSCKMRLIEEFPIFNFRSSLEFSKNEDKWIGPQRVDLNRIIFAYEVLELILCSSEKERSAHFLTKLKQNVTDEERFTIAVSYIGKHPKDNLSKILCETIKINTEEAIETKAHEWIIRY